MIRPLAARVGLGLASLLAHDASAGGALDLSDEPRTPSQATGRGAYVHTVTGVAVGRGLRLNNPYRLSSQLGDDGESLSLSATYADLWAHGLMGDPDGLQYGAGLHFAVALDGVPQQVIAPVGAALWRVGPRVHLALRVGPALVLAPDFTAGGEAGAGATWLAWSGIGASFDLVVDVYYGAATHEASATIIPVVGLQLGLVLDYEVLP